jgi:hypothetical protein
MLKRAIRAAVINVAKSQGHELNGQDKLIIRTKTGMVLAAKQRYRQRMEAPPYR